MDIQKIMTAVYIFAGIGMTIMAVFEEDVEDIGRFVSDWHQRPRLPYYYTENLYFENESRKIPKDPYGFDVIQLKTPAMIKEEEDFKKKIWS